jgi:hypothetical protein
MRKVLVFLLLIGGGYFFAPVEGTLVGSPIPTIGPAQAGTGNGSFARGRGKSRRHHRHRRTTT